MDWSKLTDEQKQSEYLKVADELKNLKLTNETLTKDVQAKDTRITELQDHNQKLFLRVTEPITDNKDKQTTNEDPITLDKFLEDLKGGK
jgi:hypothetical protein